METLHPSRRLEWTQSSSTVKESVSNPRVDFHDQVLYCVLFPSSAVFITSLLAPDVPQSLLTTDWQVLWVGNSPVFYGPRTEITSRMRTRGWVFSVIVTTPDPRFLLFLFFLERSFCRRGRLSGRRVGSILNFLRFSSGFRRKDKRVNQIFSRRINRLTASSYVAERTSWSDVSCRRTPLTKECNPRIQVRVSSVR